MKGGKAGRKRRASTGKAPRPGGGREAPRKGAVKGAGSGAPRKGSRKKSFGPSSTSSDE